MLGVLLYINRHTSEYKMQQRLRFLLRIKILIVKNPNKSFTVFPLVAIVGSALQQAR